MSATVLAVAAAFAVAALAAQVLLVLFAGTLFALLLHASAAFVSRVTKLPHLAALALVVIVVFGSLVTCAVAFGPALVTSAGEAVRDFPATLNAARVTLRLPMPARLDAATLTNAASYVVNIGLSAASVMLVVTFVAIFGAAQPRVYRRVVLELVPREREQVTGEVLDAVARTLTRWVLGRLVAMVFMGVTAYVAFRLLGVPMPELLALITGLLAFIEYLGAFLAAVPPLLLALPQGSGRALSVLAVYTVLHVIEGYVLTPMLDRATVRVPAAGVLAGQAFAAALLGPFALTFSTPMIVAVVTVITTLRGHEDRINAS